MKASGKKKLAVTTLCPCGKGKDYSDCCAPYHLGEAAPTAEALMRSRYSAYVLGLEPYLLTTWHTSTRPSSLELDSSPQPQWLGLTVKAHTPASEGETATVEFVARYKVNGRAERLHEISNFVCEAGRWFYVDGSFPAD